MSIMRLSDGRLVFHNAVPLAEAEMKMLEAWGTPAILVVPNGLHRLDVHAFKTRYPALKILCPLEARSKVEEVISVDGSLADFPADAGVQPIPLRGAKYGEAVFQVRSEGRVALCFGDMVMNIKTLPGPDGLLLTWLGSVGGPRVTWISRMLIVSDKRALKKHLLELAELPGLTQLIPSHGQIVESDAGGALRTAAGFLG